MRNIIILTPSSVIVYSNHLQIYKCLTVQINTICDKITVTFFKLSGFGIIKQSLLKSHYLVAFSQIIYLHKIE